MKLTKKKNKRHCMVVHAYYPIGEPRVQREAEALVDAGFHVDVVCLRQPKEVALENINGVNVYRVPIHRHKGRNITVQLLEYLGFFCLAGWLLTILHLRLRYSVVQTHNLPDFLVFAAIVPRITGAKVILDIHDLMPEFYISRFKSDPNSWPMRLIRWQERVAFRFANHVITVTETWRKVLLGRGLPPNKCSVVMNLADDRIFKRERIREHWPRQEGFHILYHGNLAQHCGIDLALKALSLVRRKIHHVHLTIHGRGEFVDDLRRLAGELEISECIYFSTDYIPIEELPELIATADLGIIPYRRDVFTDGILPTKLMEYAVLGIPVLAARTTAVTEYFDETMVEFFTPADVEEMAKAIERLCQDGPRLKQLGRNLLKFNQRWKWHRHKEEYIGLVKRLAEP